MNFTKVKILLKNILSLIKIKWQFSLPSKRKVLIYDSVTNVDFLFQKKNYEILHVRYEKINLNILFRTLFNYGIKNLKDNYKKSFIEFVSPKVVYTGIDNNPAFYKLKDICNKPVYISVQNGLRDNNFFLKCKQNLNGNQKLKADHIFVFGNNEKKRLSKIINAKFHVIGNIFNNNFPIKKKKIKKNIKSIMFISQFDLEMKNRLDIPYNLYRKNKEQQIFNYLIRFCKNKNIKLYFLQKRKDLTEIFFRNIFNNGSWIFLKKGTQQETYQRLNNQQMVVFHSSTLGFEALAKGIKCVSFNKVFPIPDEFNAFAEKKEIHTHFNKYPKSGPFWTNSETYSDYEKVLNKVIKYTDIDWKKIVKKYSPENLSFDSKNSKLKKILKSLL